MEIQLDEAEIRGGSSGCCCCVVAKSVLNNLGTSC